MDLADIAEGDAHAQWVVENHVGRGPDTHRQRCTICDTWWPCDLVNLAALAVLRIDALAAAEAREREYRETMLDAVDCLHRVLDPDSRPFTLRPTREEVRLAIDSLNRALATSPTTAGQEASPDAR